MLIWVLHKDLDMVNGHQHDSLHPMPLPVCVSYTSRHHSAAALPLNVTHHIYSLCMFYVSFMKLHLNLHSSV